MKIFVIMPFNKIFDDIWDNIKLAAKEAVLGEEIHCCRLDEIKSAGRISDNLILEIEKSALCIADITGNNPNVMWEVGYAMALNKPILFISQSLESTPFDIKDMRIIRYERERLSATLRKELSESIRETLILYEVRRESITIRAPEKTAFTIAITGSMRADPTRCLRRVQSLFCSYLGANTTWFVGSFGVIDETAVDYLASMKQRVIVVGYDSYDISEIMLEKMEKHQIPFIDAQKEQLLRSTDAPSERDLLFATKADLIILIWDGKSHNTKGLIDWLECNGKDHIVGFL